MNRITALAQLLDWQIFDTIAPKYRILIASDIVSLSAVIAQRLWVVSQVGLPTGSDER